MKKLRYPKTTAVAASFIIPVKNEEKHLQSCIESIQRSARGDRYEIVVVDNGSTDRSADIAKSFGCRVIRNPDGGAAGSRNAGAAEANGELFAFIDADCLIDQRWFEYAKEQFESPKVVAFGAKIGPDFADATWIEKCIFYLNNRRGVGDGCGLMKVRWIGTSNMMVRRQAFETTGGFDSSLATGEDYDLCERLSRFGDIMLDSRIQTIHLGESKTLGELFRREVWRGQTSLSHWVRNGFTIYEAPSVIIPCSFLFSFLLSIFLAPVSLRAASAALFLSMLSPLSMVLRSRRAVLNPVLFIQCIAISATYLLARSISMFKEAVGIQERDRLSR